jgi:hypothetical protein
VVGVSGLKWVRLDTSIWCHDKTLDLLAMKDGHKAFTLYVFGLSYSGLVQTDGRIPCRALPMIQGTRHLADTLVDAGLWRHMADGAYEVINYAERQQSSETTDKQVESRRRAACTRWMKEGRPCSCGTHLRAIGE